MSIRSTRQTCFVSHRIARSFALSLVLSGFAGQTSFAQAPVLTSKKPPEPEDETTVPACKTDLRLSGSVYDAEHPERSLAVFEVPSTHASAVYKLGSRVGALELIAVVPRGVFLRGSDGECWLRLVGDASGAHRRVVVQPKPQPKKPKASKAKSKNPKPGAAVVIGGAR